MAKESLDPFFQPRSIAIVGASPGKGGFADHVLWNLRNYGVKVPVTAIHPRHTEVDGYPCRPSLSAMDYVPDLVIIGVRRESVAGLLAECVKLKVPAVTIVAVGFAEQHDEAGYALQAELDRIHAGSATRIIGPNTIGVGSFMFDVVSTATGNMPPSVPRGPIAVVSKSGGLATGIVNRGIKMGLGFSFTVALGNEMDVTFGEVLEYVGSRDEVKTVICYMESIRDLQGLRKAIASCNARGKPVIFLKGGATSAGSHAAASHTGRLTGDGAIWRGLAAQFGLVEAVSLDHALTTALIFSKHGPAVAKSVGGMGQGGGMTVLLADMFARGNLHAPTPSPETQAKMRAALTTVPPNNPFDTGGVYLGGDGTELPRALRALAEDPAIGAMIIMAIPTHRERTRVIIAAFIAATADLPKPVIVLSYDSDDSQAHDMLRKAGILVIAQPDTGIQSIKSWLEYESGAVTQPNKPRMIAADATRTQAVQAHLTQAIKAGDGAILEDDGKALLGRYGLRYPAERVVTDAPAAVRAAEALGYPVALKILSQAMLHRGIGKGVFLGLRTPDQVNDAFARLGGTDPAPRVLVQRMAEPGVEFLIGALRDPEFGLVMAIGLGGARAELMKDTLFCAPPVTRHDLRQMLDRWPVLNALLAHGDKIDTEALLDAALAVAQFLAEAGEAVAELDVNPVIVGPPGAGAVAVDALIILQSPGAGPGHAG